MTANEVWIDAIIQRPAMRLRTSRSARRSDSVSKRPASSSERPIVLPSRIPETESDSCTRLEMSAIDSCRTFAILRRWSPTRFVIQTNSGSSASAKSVSCQSSRNIAITVASTVGHVRDDRGRGRGDDVLDAADVVREPRLHLAGARAREEREREPLQVPVDGRAQVVHHALADLVREQRLDDAERAGDDRDRDHPGDEQVQQREVAVRAAPRRGLLAAAARGRRRGRRRRGSAPRTPASLSRYGRKSATIRRRYARRTAGSAGRSGGSS